MNEEVHNHGKIPAEIAENLKEFFPDHVDLSYEEFLAQQESVYQSIQANGRNKERIPDYGQSSDMSQTGQEGESSGGGSSSHSGKEGDSSRHGSIESQVALDEALARSLQEFGDDFGDFVISEHSGSAVGSTELTIPRETPVSATTQGTRQDDIDPDNMTYEQLLSLGENVGNESKGLSQELISQLSTHKYKTGMFSKKKKKEECVICWTEYKSGDELITVPCAHQYHSKCIKRWFELNKTCPVCQKEVQDC